MGVIFESILGGLLRYLLAGVISWLITNGIANEEQVTQLLAGITGALILLGWMVWNKVRAHVKVLTALAVPKGTTVEDLHILMSKGVKVPASTPNDAIPVPVRATDSVRPRPGSLAILLASSVLATSCAGLTPAPNAPGTTPPIVTPPAATLNAEQIHQKAVEFAAVGTAVLGLAQQALEMSHVLIAPSPLRLSINDAASALGRALKDIATRAKAVVDEPTLRGLFREVLKATDDFLTPLWQSGSEPLKEFGRSIIEKVMPIREFLAGGAQ